MKAIKLMLFLPLLLLPGSYSQSTVARQIKTKLPSKTCTGAFEALTEASVFKEKIHELATFIAEVQEIPEDEPSRETTLKILMERLNEFEVFLDLKKLSLDEKNKTKEILAVEVKKVHLQAQGQFFESALQEKEQLELEKDIISGAAELRELEKQKAALHRQLEVKSKLYAKALSDKAKASGGAERTAKEVEKLRKIPEGETSAAKEIRLKKISELQDSYHTLGQYEEDLEEDARDERHGMWILNSKISEIEEKIERNKARTFTLTEGNR